MYRPQIQHTNPSKFKIPYHLCNRRVESFAESGISEQSQSNHNYQYSQVNYYDEISDQNRGLRHQLNELKKFNMQLRRRLEGKEKQLQLTDKQFKQALIKYNKRLETSNSSMTDLLMNDSKSYIIEREKSRSRSKSTKNKLLAIKKELQSIDCGGWIPSSKYTESKYSRQ